MRIIAGKFRGRILTKSDHLKSLRPTTDKNRQALFNILSSAKFIKEIGFEIEGSRILDVCCGSGAIVFEALSRGAKSAVLIDKNRIHLELAKKNSEILCVEKDVRIVAADAKILPKNEEFFDMVFIDPPYEEDYLKIVESLLVSGWIKKKSLVIVEFLTKKNFSEDIFSEKLKLFELRKYGSTSFGFFTVAI